MKQTISNNTVLAHVQDVRALTDSTVVIRFDRNNLNFEPGQYVSVGIEGMRENREYSIYSSPDKDYMEILVKDITGGVLSPHLCTVVPGDILRVAGPFGYFTISKDSLNKRFLFIATGTGISPFHSLVSAHPAMAYHICHGVSYDSEQYDRSIYGERYTGCISRESGGDYHGRVTECIKGQTIAPDTLCYLCGNCDMIYDVFDILIGKGVHPDNLHAEVYF
ncbi:hypothetical protein BVX99_02880 [bacterium F16]|nr:hypothetical protein BVX99_02880 [bacterium F16]